MSLYKCIIVDDEQLARELIANHLSNLDEFEVIASCHSAIEAQQVLLENPIDLMFLDIEMPVLKGTDFYQSLVKKPKVIFTTAYRDYALEGFELDAIDYLLKPIVFSRFFKAIEKFKASHQLTKPTSSIRIQQKSERQYLFVRENRKQVKIIFDQIYFIQGLKDYLKIFTTEGNHVIKSTISGFEKELPAQFARVHRSFIVNRDQVSAFTGHEVEIADHEIPIGENYKKVLKL